MVARVAEHLADEARGLADVLVDDGGGDDLEEGRVDVVGDRAREQRLARPWRAVEEHALGRLDADALEELRVDERELDHLAQLADLLVEAADGRVLHVARVLGLHVEHHRVDLARQLPHDRQRRHVERDARALRELSVSMFLRQPTT